MANTPKFNMRTLQTNQAQPELIVNPAFRTLEVMSQLRVLDKDLTDPPATPSDGDTYIPAATATGVWAGKENYIANWALTTWLFIEPRDGYRAWMVDEQAFYQYEVSSPVGWIID